MRGKNILITGHTGFKGSWLTLWLKGLGANVYGYSLPEENSPASYTALGIPSLLQEEKIADIEDRNTFENFYRKIQPDLVFHLAAQALVSESYKNPLRTVQTNILGTTHVLEAIRTSLKPCVCVVVTSDKCYENDGRRGPYYENDRMGGHDVYSMSKGACELLVSSYRRSFGIRVATARAGNVFGGGDYAKNRIIPDCVRALRENRAVMLRNPNSIRPWQFVLEPLCGYIALAEKLLSNDAEFFCKGWNFGPHSNAYSVQNIVELFFQSYGKGTWEQEPLSRNSMHEAANLSLDITLASRELGWSPSISLEKAIQETAMWYREFEAILKARNPVTKAMQELSLLQIEHFKKFKKGKNRNRPLS